MEFAVAMHPYVFFSGNCREAMRRYQEIFRGELDLMSMSDVPGSEPVPADQADLVMHAALRFGDNMLMASDDPSGDGGPKLGFSVSYEAADTAEAERVFAGLADGGEVTMPLEETFWAPRFGMCVDRFGTPWMVSAPAAPEASGA